MYIETLNSCCGIAELSNFTKGITATQIKKEIALFLEKDLADSTYGLKEATNWKPFSIWIATTSENQPEANKALKTLGFTKTTGKTAHFGQNYKIYLWKRVGLPRDIRARIKKFQQEYIKDYNEEDWY